MLPKFTSFKAYFTIGKGVTLVDALGVVNALRNRPLTM